jgi:hypothetical protein
MIRPTGRRGGTSNEPDPLESCGAVGWRGAIDRPGSLAGRGDGLLAGRCEVGGLLAGRCEVGGLLAARCEVGGLLGGGSLAGGAA